MAVSVGTGVGVEVSVGRGVGDGVAVGVEVAVGRGVSVGFTSPAGNQARIWLSCEEPGLPRMAADTEAPAPGQKAPTAIRHKVSIRSNNGMEIRLPFSALGGACIKGWPLWMVGLIRVGSPSRVEEAGTVPFADRSNWWACC